MFRLTEPKNLMRKKVLV